jgi:hypothetical protein
MLFGLKFHWLRNSLTLRNLATVNSQVVLSCTTTVIELTRAILKVSLSFITWLPINYVDIEEDL